MTDWYQYLVKVDRVQIYSRQLPIVLQLILQCRKLLDNALALFLLCFVIHRSHSSVKIVNGAGLEQSADNSPVTGGN